MATETAVHCLCAREDVEVDEQTSRCLRCGKPAREAFLTPAMRDRNAGAPPRSPSQAYRSTIDVLKQATGAVREAEASVRLDGETHVNTPTHMPDQSAGSEAAPPAPTPSPQAETKQPAAPAPVPADVVVRAAKWALAPVVPTPPEPGRPTREWLQQTRALADGFLTRADLEDVAAADARATAAAHTVEATRLRKRAALFTQLLQAIGTDVAPEPLLTASRQDSLPAPAARPTGSRWSHHSAVQVDACIDCGRADVPHIANGRCRVCDGRWRAAGQPKKAAVS